ncbi:hypothetical protein M513_06326 [Trichuris suis]|uniref:Integrase catalytic domain-containing protein n=1 Tax=Trichuris suis TaxID=68888 RepID=A0A085M6I9_9BILA|nr:hypothetical protein M513_06326 [Trichuris suis]
MGSRQVIYCLSRLFATHELPEVLVSDNGPSFDSKQFRTFCSANRTKFLRIPPYHPASRLWHASDHTAITTMKRLRVSDDVFDTIVVVCGRLYPHH